MTTTSASERRHQYNLGYLRGCTDGEKLGAFGPHVTNLSQDAEFRSGYHDGLRDTMKRLRNLQNSAALTRYWHDRRPAEEWCTDKPITDAVFDETPWGEVVYVGKDPDAPLSYNPLPRYPVESVSGHYVLILPFASPPSHQRAPGCTAGDGGVHQVRPEPSRGRPTGARRIRHQRHRRRRAPPGSEPVPA